MLFIFFISTAGTGGGSPTATYFLYLIMAVIITVSFGMHLDRHNTSRLNKQTTGALLNGGGGEGVIAAETFTEKTIGAGEIDFSAKTADKYLAASVKQPREELGGLLKSKTFWRFVGRASVMLK